MVTSKYLTITYRSVMEALHLRTKKFVYVAMGDSTSEGIGATNPDKSFAGIIYQSIQAYKKESEYHNLGLQESRVKDVLQNQLDKAIALQPNLITLSIGANDLKYATPLRQFEKDLKTILTRLGEETTALIVISTIPDISSAPVIPVQLKTLTNLFVRRFNRIISELARHHNVQLVDFYTQSRIFAKSHPEIFSTDRYHPSDFGYALWANTIITQIQETIFHKKKFFSWMR